MKRSKKKQSVRVADLQSKRFYGLLKKRNSRSGEHLKPECDAIAIMCEESRVILKALAWLSKPSAYQGSAILALLAPSET